jgi:hypothetical protein
MRKLKSATFWRRSASPVFFRGAFLGFYLIFASTLVAAWQQGGRIENRTLAGPRLQSGQAYQFLFSVDSYSSLPSGSSLAVSLSQGETVLLKKSLHQGDADLFATFSPVWDGAVTVTLGLEGAAQPTAGRYSVRIDDAAGGAVEREPNNSWRQATPVKLGLTLFASADDLPYLPADGASSGAGEDWYKFEFGESAPKLVFFSIDLMERDNVPVDVSVFRVNGEQAVAFRDGEDPVTAPHEVQALPGNKFTVRTLKERGTYYIRVNARHPEYKLRTRVYDPPPYKDPQVAVQTAVDYIMGAGDSWHANTPRRGGIYDRVANVHQETSLCVACHATHFPQRAQLYAARNGYVVHQRQQLQFLTERFYNNPRPFYGFEKDGAVWARVISAPANVLGRMSHLMQVYEQEVSGERRESFHRGVREYLKLYYKNKDKLPPDETNGNTPLVSTYEVAWYAWEVTRDPAIASMIAQDDVNNDVKNMVDLCYQTLALAAFDRNTHAAKLRANAERILSLQRPSGQWAMKFEAKEPEVEFQTGHALWALQAAGVPADHPQVKKAIDYLLARQQSFGGWMDPLQSYENFKTPFRETQMSVLALSSYFPNQRKGEGWDTPAASLKGRTLESLDNVWGRQPDRVLEMLAREARSSDVMVRQQALEAIGRSGAPSLLPVALDALGDSSKLVQRTAAWAVRQIATRNEDVDVAGIEAALRSASSRARWGATRIFATHFSSLAQNSRLAEPLIAAASAEEPAIRIQALKGLWQWWHWSADEQLRSRIEDVFIEGLPRSGHPWVARNLREGLYTISDENIRYLYNNWIPLLGSGDDRSRAIRGRLAVEDRLAAKFTRVLGQGSDQHRKELLNALTSFHLRRADVYDPQADSSVPGPAVYNRIGNDVEQIVFYGTTSAGFARALAPLIDSPDTELRRLATRATLLVRDQAFPGVMDAAGAPGPDRDKLLAAVIGGGTAETDVVKGLLGKKAPAAATPSTGPPAPLVAKTGTAKPDEQEFHTAIRPLLEKKGKDGYACVQCHATHTLFNGSYATALNVIDTEKPEKSLLLRKPTSSAETEGVVGSRTISHGGGVRWEAGSPEYTTILNWIRNAR